MKRKVIQIDQDRCVGCGLCTKACMQGAIQLVDGKAKLVSESYCDGLGMCLPQCPMDAIKLVEKETESFNTERANIKLKSDPGEKSCGCPSSRSMVIEKDARGQVPHSSQSSYLRHWPIQLHLVNPTASYFQNANLLICADCVMAAYGDFQEKLLKNRTIAVACPKLDNTAGYVEKLGEILTANNIKTIVVARMEVPCCGGISRIVNEALEASGKHIPLREVVITMDGKVK